MNNESSWWLIPFVMFWAWVLWNDFPRKSNADKREEQAEQIRREGGYRGQ